jgi:hypothetical protein
MPRAGRSTRAPERLDHQRVGHDSCDRTITAGPVARVAVCCHAATPHVRPRFIGRIDGKSMSAAQGFNSMKWRRNPPSPAVAATATPTTANSPPSKLTMSNSPVGWAIRGVYAPSLTGLWARLRAVPTRKAVPRGHCFAWAGRAAPACRLKHPSGAFAHPTKNLALSLAPFTFAFCFFLLTTPYSLFLFATPMRGWRSADRRPGAANTR